MKRLLLVVVIVGMLNTTSMVGAQQAAAPPQIQSRTVSHGDTAAHPVRSAAPAKPKTGTKSRKKATHKGNKPATTPSTATGSDDIRK